MPEKPAGGGHLLTIGHSTHALETFVDLLRRHRVTAVADVRAVPYSRFNPQFNRETLAADLARRRIEYVFLGAELGGRSDNSSHYKQGRIQYDRLRGTERFGRGLDRVVRGAERHRVALLCAEKDPLECHRFLLVAHALVGKMDIGHIRPDGGLESHADALGRLLALHGMQLDQPRLFGDPVADAIAKQAWRVGHRMEAASSTGGPAGSRTRESPP